MHIQMLFILCNMHRYTSLVLLNRVLYVNDVALAIVLLRGHPGPIRPGARPGPRNNVGPENKVGPRNKVGPKNKVGPGSRVGPPVNIYIYIHIYIHMHIYIYSLLAIAYSVLAIP